MSRESLIFFFLVLAVWGLSVAARWLQAQMEKHSTDGIEFEPIEWSPGSIVEPAQESESFVMPDQGQPSSAPPVDRTLLVRPKRPKMRLGLGNPQTLRQGIILMTILGPCRALEPSNDLKPF